MSSYIQQSMRLVENLLLADTECLISGDWQLPKPSHREIRDIQQQGYETYGNKFKFLGYLLQQFINSPKKTRKKDNADVLFELQLGVESDLLVYSGTIDDEYVSKRVKTLIPAPFKAYKFNNPETKWFNISDRRGMKKYFKRHSQQILDFFSVLIIRRLNQGKRSLLISKEKFKGACAQELEKRLHEAGYTDIKIVIENWDKYDLGDHNIIPMIHYGVVGVNLFQHFDSAYCLNSYYINNPIVESKLRGCHSSEIEPEIKMGTNGDPPRRWAAVTSSTGQNDNINRLVNSILYQEEMGVVMQAVGRVRPFTSPREIITFECHDNLQHPYSRDFTSLQEAREYFGIKKRRTQDKEQIMTFVKQAMEQGLSKKQMAGLLGKHLRTIQRYCKEICDTEHI